MNADAYAARLIRSPSVSQSNIITSITEQVRNSYVRSVANAQRCPKERKRNLHARTNVDNFAIFFIYCRKRNGIDCLFAVRNINVFLFVLVTHSIKSLIKVSNLIYYIIKIFCLYALKKYTKLNPSY